MSTGTASGRTHDTAWDRYTRAERFLPWQARRLVFQTELEPHWLDGGARFWFRQRTRTGVRHVLVDPGNRSLDFAFQPPAGGSASIPAPGPGEEVEAGIPSPDGRWTVYAGGDNLVLRCRATGDERRLTGDGQPGCSYHRRDAFGNSLGPNAVWSPDSSRLLICRVDVRHVRRFTLIASVPDGDNPQPRVYTYPYVLPGDEAVPIFRYSILAVDGGSTIPIEALSGPHVTPPISWWADDGSVLYALLQSRDARAVRLLAVDPATGRARTLIHEESAARIDLHAYPSIPRLEPLEGGRRLRVTWIQPHNVRVIGAGREIIWYSHRDGWGHLYLYDANSGELKNRITTGPWVVHDVVHVDEQAGWLYFTAGGREPGRDPYYRHLYRVRLDGSGLELLTPEDADHSVIMSPNGRYFIDVYARVDLPPVTVIRDAEGRFLMEVQRADVGPLLETGWQPPERFRVKAADGVTDIYGVIFKPSDFDPSRKYPVLNDIYPGPHCIHTPKSFPTPRWEPAGGQWTGDGQVFWRAQALAELGLLVVILDARGTPLRGTDFHRVSYGCVANPEGLRDHVAAIRQLAEDRPYMDLSRVGIYGISAGGYAAARALLTFPDFFKVGVSVAGNHDPRLDKAAWVERYQGPLTEATARAYARQCNSPLATGLRGRLLLVHGELDDNVHPAHTLQLVQALMDANKDFDLLMLPNRRHDVRDDPYFIRRLWDYLTRHLIGLEPPPGYCVPVPPEHGEQD